MNAHQRRIARRKFERMILTHTKHFTPKSMSNSLRISGKIVLQEGIKLLSFTCPASKARSNET